MEHKECEQQDSAFELLRRAITQGDQDAQVALQHYLHETLLAWLHSHPSREVACRWESEEHYVALAFERFWQVALQGQVPFKSFAEALICLRASLHGAILDTLRACARPGAVSLLLGDRCVDDHPASLEAWETLQTVLPNGREQRLVYLLYYCGLSPREIIQRCPQEWNDLQEIAHLRRTILERLLHYTNALAPGAYLRDTTGSG